MPAALLTTRSVARSVETADGQTCIPRLFKNLVSGQRALEAVRPFQQLWPGSRCGCYLSMGHVGNT